MNNSERNPTLASGASRRSVLGALGAAGGGLLLGACSTSSDRVVARSAQPSMFARAREALSAGDGSGRVNYATAYDALPDEGYVIPAVPWERIDPRYLRHYVENTTGEGPGQLIVDTDNYFVYKTEADGMAWRYGCGLGRAGFAWSGRAVVQWKRKWPTWTPPAEMIAREPELEEFSAANGGMEPGLTNPLGARALYIFQGGEDTLYRLHGSPEWNSIGRNVSSGCVRLMNQDIVHLYDRVPNGTPLLVTSGLRAPSV